MEKPYSYTLKVLDRQLWRAAHAKAKQDGENLKAVIQRLLKEWLGR